MLRFAQPMPTPLPPAVDSTPVVRYGPGARIFMLAAGILFAGSFGPLGVFVAGGLRAHGILHALGTILGSGLLLAPAVYGLFLAWRGLRGSWRPAAWSRRLALGVGAVLAAMTLAVIPVALVQMLRTDHLAMLRGGVRSVGGLDWYFSLVILTTPVQLAAHELGHVVAGRLVWFDFLSVQVGPLCLDRSRGKWRVTWQPLAFGFGGRATMLFHGNHDLPGRTAVFAAGGPIANLLLAALAGFASTSAARPTTEGAALTIGILNACAFEGLLLCAYNLIPIRLAGNDGARILEALRPKQRAVRQRTVTSSSERRTQGSLRLIEAPPDRDEAPSPVDDDIDHLER